MLFEPYVRGMSQKYVDICDKTRMCSDVDNYFSQCALYASK